MIDLKAKCKEILATVGDRHVDIRLLILMALVAITIIAVTLWLLVSDLNGRRLASNSLEESQEAVTRVSEIASLLQQLLDDDQVRQLAIQAVENPQRLNDLQQYMSGRIPEIQSVDLVDPALEKFDPAASAAGFALLDMLFMAQKGLNPPLQMHGSLQPPQLVDATAIKQGEEVVAYLVVHLDPEFIRSRFNPDMSASHYISLTQYNGRQSPTVLKQRGELNIAGQVPERMAVAGTLFRLEIPVARHADFLSGSMALVALVLGALMLLATVFLYRQSKAWDAAHPRMRADKAEPQADTSIAAAAPEEPDSTAEADFAQQPPELPEPSVQDKTPAGMAKEPPAASEQADPPPMRLRYDIKQRHRTKAMDTEPVELTAEIFRAYDIRGIVGKTLDAGVAAQVGQVLGTLALEKNAGPVVVARDGRLSGPGLVDGMIEGITASGCDVLDIGAVPTGVLYYAAHEMAAGSGVMITGSHNPPDYNGFKIMVAGDTLYGTQISDIYRRITEADYRVGEGSVEHKDVIPQYRERIKSDIQLDRPLRVVIDCGNGIGGVCAADVLRDIGAEVLPLFDEVDGTFPNHHPDPSDPENLKDLIESVRLMDADLGLALDGDADRLGVVTLGGSIIYADRIMMLLAMDVLDRVPGATIIYDVKCTGHLAKVIKEAGGNPVMYKTGHSLIKARMKEIDSPFAGEMSGHFFFGERWYGVDDGIYAAARLLEILAGAEAPPEAILNALPTSYSTPELKIQMQEGENHAFIDQFQAQARFEDAKVSKIDGVRADFDDGWGLVRASNTTPILVVRFDAETKQALERIKNVFRSRMLAINPDLELPF